VDEEAVGGTAAAAAATTAVTAVAAIPACSSGKGAPGISRSAGPANGSLSAGAAWSLPSGDTKTPLSTSPSIESQFWSTPSGSSSEPTYAHSHPSAGLPLASIIPSAHPVMQSGAGSDPSHFPTAFGNGMTVQSCPQAPQL